VNPSSLHIGENRLEPAQVKAALLCHVLHKVAAAGWEPGCPMPAQFPDLGKANILSADLGAHCSGDQAGVGKMQEEHGSVKRLSKVASGGKLRVKQLTKVSAPARGDAVDRRRPYAYRLGQRVGERRLLTDRAR
jgi:hypothetical protein